MWNERCNPVRFRTWEQVVGRSQRVDTTRQMAKRAAQQLCQRRLIVIICSWWCAVTTVTAAQVPPPSLSEEDRQVIAEVLRSQNFGRSALLDSTMFVCGEDTQHFCIGRSPGIRTTALAFLDRVLDSDEVRDAFRSANRTAQPLGNVDVGLEMVLTRRLFTSRDLWMQLGKKDLVLVTAPTYTLNRQQAFVYRERLCNGRCGGGVFVFLERQAGRWLVVRSEVIWIG